MCLDFPLMILLNESLTNPLLFKTSILKKNGPAKFSRRGKQLKEQTVSFTVCGILNCVFLNCCFELVAPCLWNFLFLCCLLPPESSRWSIYETLHITQPLEAHLQPLSSPQNWAGIPCRTSYQPHAPPGYLCIQSSAHAANPAGRLFLLPLPSHETYLYFNSKLKFPF